MPQVPPLRIETIPNAIIVPPRFSTPKPHEPAGVLTAKGRFVQLGALPRAEHYYTSPPEMPEEISPAPVEEAIYGGFLIPHFGHFMLEGLARLWYAKNSDLPIIWACPTPASGAWRETVYTALGIAPDRFIFPKSPVSVKKLHIPEAGFKIRNAFHPSHAAFLGVFPPRKTPFDGKKIYLSRARFQSKIFNLQNEDKLVSHLQTLGWDILHPETLPIEDQIALFSSAKVIAGVEGSAFHTAIFSANVTAKLLLIRREKPNINYDLIAATKQLAQHNITDQLSTTARQAGLEHSTIIDPKHLAQHLDELSAS